MKQIIAVFCLVLTSLTTQAAKRTESEAYAQVRARVVSIIAEATGREESSIKEDQAFVQDLNMDHAAHEVVRDALSIEIGRSISDESAERITTVQKAINYVFVRQQ